MEAKKEINLRGMPLPVELHRAFASKCAAFGVTQKDVLRELIERYVWGDSAKKVSSKRKT
jgi:hypothetical protein